MGYPDFVSGDVLNASDMNAVGLWKVASGTVNLTTAWTNITGVFSSTYTNYRVLMNVTARSTANRFDWRYIVGTTESTASYFASGIGSDYAANTTMYFQRSNNDSVFFFDNSAALSSYALDIYRPNEAATTYHTGHVMNNTGVAYSVGGGHFVANQNTGFRLACNTGTMTVKYAIYGYRD
jgi:hypothetical protein